MRIIDRPLRTCAAIACVVLASACGGGGGAGEEDTPQVLPVPTGGASGRVSFVRGENAVAIEAEPNDDASTAQRLADGFPGENILIFGELDAGAGDSTDAYRIRFPIRSRVRVLLDSPAGTDFTLSLYDPLSMQFVNTSTSPDAELDLLGRGLVDLVVTTAASGRYQLNISVEVSPVEHDEIEPNDDSMSAYVLGELHLNESLTLLGDAFAGGDEVDTFLLTCPESAQIQLGLTIAAFSDMLLRVSDVTGGLSSPQPLVTLDGPVSVARAGSVSVSPGTLLLLEVVAESGGGLWRMTLGSQPPGSPKATPGAPHAKAVEPRVSTVDEEGHWFATPPAYGTVSHEIVPGEVLLRYCKGREAQAQRNVAARDCQLADTSPVVCRFTFDLPVAQSPEQQARQTFARCCALAGDMCLDFAEPNQVLRAMAVPNDPLYSIQSWHYEMLNLPNAWDIQTGSSGVIVAVIDTGRLNHPDLDARQSGGYDFVTGSNAGDGDGVDPNPDDHGVQTSYHGGHVAGTIGAHTNNSVGVSGVTWAGQIMNVRVLGDYGSGSTFDIVQGILYAARLQNNSGTLPPARADIINMSLGGGGFSTSMNNACDNAKAAGVTIFAAAGNGGRQENNYPASYPAVISVMALDAQRARAPYSSWGPTVDLACPGGNTSVDTNGDGHADGVFSTGRNSGGPMYHHLNGTSMACPHAAGCAALLLSEDPTLTPNEIEQTLESTAVDLGPIGKDNTFGNGLIDIYAALQTLATVPPPPPMPVLDINPRVLNFGLARFEASVFPRNLGTGTIDVTGTSIATSSGGSWMTAELVGTGDTTTNVSSILVTVDRNGLSPGSYFGTVTVETSNAGDLDISVLVQVATSVSPPPNIDVFVRAISAETGEVVQERIVNPSIDLDFEFAGLPIGQYVFVAGTDVDGDGEICEVGDFCGTYPSAEEPETVFVTQNFQTINVNFPVLRTTAVAAGQ